MSDISLVAELARMTAYFQARTIALHMGVDPNTVTVSPACGNSPRVAGSAQGITSSQVDALRADILSGEG